ncbi:hypothetical protein [Halalkalibacter alkaliphilus]|uniref:Uncharacterized protein n=1 Tax=Halalkalibacter alkaliphilus TaxID=2917993 RepID=A0A9X2CU64_9BACI|nr:hypothetical protein [Halalkalibacter alkaliphilus]MCL7748291.1 hypothetical protein [Halalkalibacter alkaliphilus]
MNKFAYMLVGAIFTVIISIGYITFADTTDSSQSEQITQEALTVYKSAANETEEVEVFEEIQPSIAEESPILLSTGREEVTITKVDTEKTDENSHAEENTQVAKGIAIAKGNSQAKNNNQRGASFLEQLKKLEIELEDEQFEIEIKQERKKNRVKSEVEIEWKNEKIKLKNKRADNFIEELFALTEVYSAEDLPTLANKILAQYEVEWDSAEVKIKAEKADGKKYEYENK